MVSKKNQKSFGFSQFSPVLASTHPLKKIHFFLKNLKTIHIITQNKKSNV